MRRARRPRMLGATTKAMPVSIVEEERRRRRGPDRTRALRGSAIGLPPRRRPQGWRACVSPLMRVHVSGPPADVAVFVATSTKFLERTMVIAMQRGANEAQIQKVIDRLIGDGFDVHRSTGVDRTVLGVVGG